MSIELLSILFFGSLLVFLVLGLPLTFGAGRRVHDIYFTWGPEAFYMVAAQTWGAMNKFTLVAVPLFIFMAMILERSGVAKGLYEMMYLWFGPVAGGLAIGTVVICALFSAMCGISGAAVVSMGTIALPSMLQRNYDKELALGCINSGGGWGILIPPSVIMILYALISGESVGRLFAGGVFPACFCWFLFPVTSPFDVIFSRTSARPCPGRSAETGSGKLPHSKPLFYPLLL